MYQFNLQAIEPYFAQLPHAIGTTIGLSLLTAVLSGLLGIPGALARRSRWRALRLLMGLYVEAMRNVPLLIILYLVFFSLPQIGLRLDGFDSALIALTLNSTAYMTEIFRSGLIAIPRGQYEAAASQGMTGIETLRFVVLPQVVRIIYAPLGNQLIGIVLGSSLASVVTVAELTSWMGTAGAASFRYFETFVVAGGAYLAICQFINLARILAGRLMFKRLAAASRS
jgi:polar amino acid transport system permease protein